MPDQLAALRAQFREALSALERLAATVNDDAWSTRPASGGWSASECIAHLTMTTNAYLPLITASRARVKSGVAPPARYTRGFFAALLEWSLEPPSRMRTKTIPSFVPGASASTAQTLAAFAASQRALLAMLDDVATLPMNRMIIASPFNEKLTYNAYAAFRILAAHQRRHLWQAERATRGIP